MSTTSRLSAVDSSGYPLLEEKLFSAGQVFDFFQAVRLLEHWLPESHPVGESGPPHEEVVRFRVHNSLTFPPSSIQKLERPGKELMIPVMTVNFLGLTGPSGVLPRQYTEIIERLVRESDNPERYVLRDWLDLFNHRFISLFYRSWSKYRLWLAFDRQEHLRAEPDLHTRVLLSLVGLGTTGLRDRLRVVNHDEIDGRTQERELGRVSDFALLHYGGLLAHRPRSADALEGMLEDYFDLPIHVQQFQGQWLQLSAENQSCLGEAGHNNELGVSTVAGTRVWDIESKIGLRVGPIAYEKYLDLLPDRSAVPHRKRFFLLVHMARFYVGPQYHLDVQLVLKREEVPECQLPLATADGPQLGWNTWLFSQSLARDPDESIFHGEALVHLNESRVS